MADGYSRATVRFGDHHFSGGDVHFHAGARAIDVHADAMRAMGFKTQAKDRESICREELAGVRARWLGRPLTPAVRMAIETEMRARLLDRGLSPLRILVHEQAGNGFMVELVFPRVRKAGTGRWRRAARGRARRKRQRGRR